MKPITFPEQNRVYAQNQPQYLPLPCYATEDGIVTSCWKLTWKERIKIMFSGKIWLGIMTFNQRLQPQCPSVSKPINLMEK